jgi:hypothetical protein
MMILPSAGSSGPLRLKGGCEIVSVVALLFFQLALELLLQALQFITLSSIGSVPDERWP